MIVDKIIIARKSLMTEDEATLSSLDTDTSENLNLFVDVSSDYVNVIHIRI